jgi:hypothetical protein
MMSPCSECYHVEYQPFEKDHQTFSAPDSAAAMFSATSAAAACARFLPESVAEEGVATSYERFMSFADSSVQPNSSSESQYFNLDIDDGLPGAQREGTDGDLVGPGHNVMVRLSKAADDFGLRHFHRATLSAACIVFVLLLVVTVLCLPRPAGSDGSPSTTQLAGRFLAADGANVTSLAVTSAFP